MLVLRDAQMQAFIASDEAEVRRVVRNAVQAANPTRVEGYSDEKLDRMLKGAIARARGHELSKPQDIAAFVAIMFETSPRFDEQSDIADVFSDINYRPEERLYQLFERISDEVWAEAERSYDVDSWFAG